MGRQEMAMFINKTQVLLVLTQDVLDEARVLAGKATAALKLPVSLQIVLRALIEVGLKQEDRPALLANIEDQAKAVRLQRSAAPREWAVGELANGSSGSPPGPSGRGRQRPRKWEDRSDETNERRGSMSGTHDDERTPAIRA